MTEETKPTCFVIQKFDEGGTYDRRYTETVHPALSAAGVKPLRSDHMLGLQPVIEKIEKAIRDADICVAEVSTDNPNVWLELGYALAIGQPVVILCDKAIRDKLPFDIQHRPVIFYRADSKSGFEELERRIILEVKNQLATQKRVAANPVLTKGSPDVNDLKGYEVAVLASLLAMWPSSPEGVAAFELEKKLKGLGHDAIALGFGLTRLIDKGYIQKVSQYDMDREWFTYQLTPEGVAWLHDNEEKIEKSTTKTPNQQEKQSTDFDDDFPF